MFRAQTKEGFLFRIFLGIFIQLMLLILSKFKQINFNSPEICQKTCDFLISGLKFA